MSSPLPPPHAVEERKKHADASQPQPPAEDGAVPSTDVAPPSPLEPEEELWLTLADACTIAQAEVARRFKTGDETALPMTFSGVLRSWGWRREDDRDAPPPPPSPPPAEPKEKKTT